MASHRRVKDIAYDEDELYSDEEETGDDAQEYTAEDKQNFANLTPVVRAHLEEAGLQALDRQIEDALYHYYWDVEKSVGYLKKQNAPKAPATQAKQNSTPSKPKSKFDEAAAKNAANSQGESTSFSTLTTGTLHDQDHPCGRTDARRDRGLPLSNLPADQWFDNVSWSRVAPDMSATLVPAYPRPVEKLLGGSSKLARLAEERRKKAEAVKAELKDKTNEADVNTALSSLDRLALSKRKELHGATSETATPPPRKQYVKKKREQSPPPPAPEPEPEAPTEEEVVSLRAKPSSFARTLATGTSSNTKGQNMSLQDLLGAPVSSDVFSKPSPDDLARQAQSQSKGLNR